MDTKDGAPEPIDRYYANVNRSLLTLMPRQVRRVLEIGCGSGALAAAYREYNPGVFHAGVEVDPKAAAAARNVLDLVIEGDVESEETLGALPAEPFDAFVFGDVLEHLRDPWRLVKALRARAAPSAVALACIPNVQHWSVIKDLLAGQWRYTDMGLLDRTHLRFFTRESAVELFRGSGWHPFDVQGRTNSRQDGKAFIEAMGPTLDDLGIDRQRYAAAAQVYQYFVRATAAPSKAQPIRINAMTLVPTAAVNDVRIELPLEALRTFPGVQTISAVKKFVLPEPRNGTADLFIWQRPILEPKGDLPTYRRLVERRIPIVVEFDDDPDHWPRIVENDYLSFTAPHAVQTSNELLAGRMREWNPNVAIFPNYIDRLPALAPPRGEEGPLRLFFGALNREQDWQPLLPALEEVLARHGDRVEIVIVHDQKLADALRHKRKVFHPRCKYDRYRELMAACDIAWLPLNDTKFNRSKTDLKFLECAAAGVVALASRVIYEATIEDGTTGVLYGKPRDFSAKLEQLLTDAPLRERIRAAAHAYVRRDRLLGQHVALRLNWYRQLVADFPRLERERRARMARQLPEWELAGA